MQVCQSIFLSMIKIINIKFMKVFCQSIFLLRVSEGNHHFEIHASLLSVNISINEENHNFEIRAKVCQYFYQWRKSSFLKFMQVCQSVFLFMKKITILKLMQVCLSIFLLMKISFWNSCKSSVSQYFYQWKKYHFEHASLSVIIFSNDGKNHHFKIHASLSVNISIN